MLAATWLDPVLGVDMHIVLVPTPPGAPVPTPMPHPFTGMVFDVMEAVLAVLPEAAQFVAGVADVVMGGGAPGQHGALGTGIVAAADAAQTLADAAEWVTDPVGTAIEWVSGEVRGSTAANAGKVKVNGLWAAVGGGSAMAMPPHMPMPFPFASPPDNSADLKFGATGVFFEGHYPVRMFDIAESCSDPRALPTSAVVAIPKGYPVLVLRPQSPDLLSLLSDLTGNLLSALGASVWRRLRRIRWIRRLHARARAARSSARRSLHALVDRHTRPGHVRSTLREAVCHLTGEPIDVATGRVLSRVVELELPGPIPLVFERRYDSSLAWRNGPLGYGWSHSLDQAIWEEPGRVVLRDEDGREIAFETLGMPEHGMPVGHEAWLPIDRIRLLRTGARTWEAHTPDDRVREYASSGEGPARLTRVRTRNEYHAIELTYDRAGRLEWVRDSGGRLFRFEHDPRGRLTTIRIPVPHGRGWFVHSRFEYDEHGDLVRAADPGGSAHRYAYSNHLKVRKTDRSGLSFYYEYDGTDASARCVRSWGDGGILHRVLHYLPAKRTTIVEDSYGRPTTYVTGETGLVEQVIDPLGAVTRNEHDPITGALVRRVDAAGAETRCEWDDRGNCTAVIGPDGHARRSEWDEHDRLLRTVLPSGAEWRLTWNLAHELVAVRDPVGATTRYEYARGLLTSTLDATGARTVIEHDERKSPSRVVLPSGGELRIVHDELGRVVKTRNALGGVEEIQYDALGRELSRRSTSGHVTSYAYDLEDNPVEIRDPNRHIVLRYGSFHRIVAREEAGTSLRFEYDLECRLTAVVNEAGERYEYHLDAAGRPRAETGFDGGTRRFERDRLGRVVAVTMPSGRRSTLSYDPAGRLHEVLHSDGCFTRFAFDADGSLARAENESALVELERDPMGRIIAERVNGAEVRSEYDPAGRRRSFRTSLGASVALDRDALGLPGAMYFGGGGGHEPDVRFERDALGYERVRAFANGIDLEWNRDVAGKPLARRTYRAERGAPMHIPGPPRLPARSAQREELDARDYLWRGDDQIAAIVDAASGPRFLDHNARGELVRERRPGSTVERGVDVVGNVYRTLAGTDRRYGRGGRLEQADGIRYEYDEDGNQIRKSGPDGDWLYLWNGHGQLREVQRPDGTRVSFEYDVFSRRTLKRSTSADGELLRETKFVWDGDLVVHDDDTRDGLSTWHWVPSSFTPLAKERDGRRWSIATDHLGTPTEMYDDAGQLAWKMQLGVFGVPTFEAGDAADCPWRWPGQQEDSETGLYFNRHRYFDASTGGYLAPDPIGFRGGSAFYAYVPDPTTFSDPLGLAKDACQGLPQLKGRSVAEIERILTLHGFVRTKVSASAAKNQTWNHADGSEVRIHAYGNLHAGPWRSGNNGHVHKVSATGDDLDDHGNVSTDPAATHIGISNPPDLPTVRGRPHGDGVK